jgi:hypothetical protein
VLKVANGLEFPPEIAGRRTAIFGISGSGKSNTAAVLIEGLLQAGEQVVIVDPKGEAWGFLSLANGKPSNLPLIIFGEPNGHISELSEGHGPKLADFVFESGQSIAVSLVGFDSDQSERRFVAAFMRRLYRLKAKAAKKTRTLVVFEEAHLFVPEGGGGRMEGEKAELSGSIQRIARQGRSFGLGSLFIDQRPQDVSKRVISQVDTIICHQLTHKTDRTALSDWVKGYDVEGRGQQFLDSLASLEPGEAWIWSPSWLKIFKRAKIHLRKTFDSGAAPDEGQAKRVERAEIDLDQLRGQLAELVEKAKADDPKELRAKIRDLERQLAEKPAESVDQGAIDAAVNAAVLHRDAEWDAELRSFDSGHLQPIRDLLSEIFSKTSGAGICDAFAFRPFAAPRVPQMIARTTAPKPFPPQFKAKAQATCERSSNGSAIPRGELAVLKAAASRENGVDKKNLRVLTGFKRSTRDAYIARLREKGFVEDSLGGGSIVATRAGKIALGDHYEPLPTGRELREQWLGKLPEGERRVLELLILNHPRFVGHDSISDGTEFKRSTRDAYLYRLRARGLILSRLGESKASDDLF